MAKRRKDLNLDPCLPKSHKFVDLTGKTFGKFTVIAYAGKDVRTNSYWHCRCECGHTDIYRGETITSGRTASCGLSTCSHRFVHGHANTPTYVSWRALRDRCYDETNPRYHSHGARGITVCERWQHSFENFLADMGERPAGTSIDRIDNDGNYTPENCRWATPKEQANNRRRRTIRSEITLASQASGIKYATIAARMHRKGMTLDEAISAG